MATKLTPYPDAIGFAVVSIPAGFSLYFDKPVFVPTSENSAIPFSVRSGEAVATGDYEIVIRAMGGGISREIPITIRVNRPSFTLSSNLNTVELQRSGTVQLAIQTTPREGSTSPITFQVTDAPAGIEWRFSHATVVPGEATVLTLADTADLAGGTYSPFVVGDDGTNRLRFEVLLFVSKPSFELKSDVQALTIQNGGQLRLPLQLDPVLGWNEPITLAVQTLSTTDGLEVGFAQSAAVTGAALDPPLLTTITILPNDPVFVVIKAQGSDSTDKVTTFQIVAAAPEIRRTLTVQVTIQPHQLYLPFIGR